MNTAESVEPRTRHLDGNAKAREIVATRIIELARRGERNPTRLRDRVLQEANKAASYDPH
jgi:hypothetical protein